MPVVTSPCACPSTANWTYCGVAAHHRNLELLTWIDFVWLLSAGACLTLALVHGGSWLRERTLWADLWFAVAAFGVFGVGLVEIGELNATTPERFIAIHYWIHLGLFFAGIGLLCFVPAFFHAGRRWLFVLAIALRFAVLVVNFSLPHGINYAAVPAIERLHLGGGSLVTVALGVHTHWTHLDEVAWLVAILFTADAACTAWRRTPREQHARIARVAGAMLFVYLLGVPLSALVHAGIVHTPYFVTPLFLALLATMGNELASDVARSVKVRRKLQESEARLVASEEDLELAAEAVGLGLGALDFESGELTVNPRGRQLFGAEAGQPILLPELLSRVHPEDRERVGNAVAEAASSQSAFHEEYRIATPNGGWRWLASRGRVTAGLQGARPRLRGVTFEITGQRQAEERFRLVFDSAESAFLIVDADGRIQLANARAEVYFGYSRAQLMDMSLERLLPERLRAAHVEHRADYARAPKTRRMGLGQELVALRQDGSEFPVEVGLSPLPGPNAGTILASVIDISARREAELAAARQRSELAHLSRIAVLGELSGSLAHELNQPLAAILSNAQAAQRFLEREDVDLEQLGEIVHDIIEDDKRAGEVIRRLRAMLRKEELAHTPLDLNELVRDVLQIMNSDFINRGVVVETRFARDLPNVSGDRVQLQQVLLNILINGCEAMAERSRPRELLLRTLEDGSTGVQLTVTDQGAGISSDVLERLFEPFVTTKAQGTGLGLAVCRTIIEAHDGRIWARNNDAAGATFHVTLPAVAPHADD